MSGYRFQVDLQRAFLPHQEVLLLDPVIAVLRDDHVEVKYDQGENETHLAVCETKKAIS